MRLDEDTEGPISRWSLWHQIPVTYRVGSFPGRIGVQAALGGLFP